VALSFGGTTQAVMMATPQDLEDFGVGFALSEAISPLAGDIASLDIIEADQGFDVQMQLAGDLQAGLFRPSPQDGRSRGLRAVRHRIHRRSAAPACRIARRWTSRFSRRRDPRGGPLAVDAPGAARRKPARCMPPASIASGQGHGLRARGCRPPQCARQADRRHGALKAKPGRRRICHYQPCLGRHGAEGRDRRHRAADRRLCAHRACRADCRSLPA
jgi:hypothetical protein